ncbi:uridine kinase [Mycolicibacterium sp. P1-18]|uniref:uridine kinase n=1 Tax=Mycolicibacterium sp. P1-18 TaxID=2024615 RepID=UPI0011F10135|nr:uridine kinase [Mycolicibacterium sp. P1-18]KAA0099812.1 uridine kinase [Mycolicibacterium sp. P1-18]
MTHPVLRAVAARVPTLPGDDCVRVAVDGPDGAGKTRFADGLATALHEAGRPVVRVSVDGFHHPRATRYRRGRDSPDGFWLDSYDYARFTADVLTPFAHNGSRRYRPAAHDVATDTALTVDARVAAPSSVLVVDGIFLQRAELAGAWHLTIFLDVPFAETTRRMAARDGTSPDPDDPRTHRYVEGQRLYFAACDPRSRADVLVDNADFDAPRLLR